MPYVPGDDREAISVPSRELAKVIARVIADKRGDGAAMAGYLNFALTEVLQELPKELVDHGVIKDEMRYWMQPLMYGVLLDVVMEHKRRANSAYEAFQLAKNGDCYRTPYYTRLVEVLDEEGNHVGFQEVMMQRSNGTIDEDVLKSNIVITLRDAPKEDAPS